MNKKVLRLAIPNIISNLSVPLLGIVDTAVVGHLEHVYYLGAIAVGSIIFDFIFWGFGFLRMGTTGLVAQALGAGNTKETRIILGRVAVVAGIVSTLLLLLQLPIIEFALRIIDASPDVEQYTRVYYHIRIFSAPATLMLFGMNGWFLGMQNARYPMFVTIALNILNIILNLFLVLVLELNVAGVAWGSLISTYLALIFAFLLFRFRYSETNIHINFHDLLDLDELKRFFSVNTDIFIRTICLIFSYAFFTANSAASGEIILAANTILLQFWYMAAYATDGFAFAAESLVGRYKGAKDPVLLKKAVAYTMGWGIALGALGSLVYYLSGDILLTIFTDKTSVIIAAGHVFIWTIMAPLINSVCFIWDGVYIGSTTTAPMRNSMLIATILVFLPVYYFMLPYTGVHALWIAMTSFMVVRGIALSAWAPRYIFNYKRSS